MALREAELAGHLPPRPGLRDALPCPGPGRGAGTFPPVLYPDLHPGRRTMAHLIEDRLSTTPDELAHARERLAKAFAGRDHARERYEAAVGTSCELGAYM